MKSLKNFKQRLMSKSLYSQLFPILVLIIVLIAIYTAIQILSTDNTQWSVQRESNINRREIAEKNLINKYIKVFNQKVAGPFSKLLNSINLPKRIQLNDSQTLLLVEKESNLAATYWQWWDSFKGESNIKPNVSYYCKDVQLTSPIKLRHNNLHWQLFDAVSTNQSEETVRMFLYNAYYDHRIKEAPMVKLVTMNNQELLGNGRNWSCLLWFDNTKSPVLVKVSEYYNIWPEFWRKNIKYGVYHPQLISCPIPKEYYGEIPRAISLQNREKCEELEKEPSNVLRVIHNERNPTFKNRSIGICVQAFRFGTYDVSVRLVEWLEMVRLLGADRVYFYVHGMTDNIQQVLRHYQKDGLVDWRPLTLPGEQPNVNSLYNTLAYKGGEYFWPSESLELNDCLYRNIYRHDYLAVIDIDEVIMPQKVNTWQELIEQIESGLSENDLKWHGYYSNLHSHVCEGAEETMFNKTDSLEPIPEYLYLSRHTHRANVLGATQNNKCFHRTDRVTAVHNHFPMRCIGTNRWLSCPGMTIDPKDSVLMHYRRNTSNPALIRRNTDCPVHDQSAWRYYDEMRDRVKRQLENIFA